MENFEIDDLVFIFDSPPDNNCKFLLGKIAKYKGSWNHNNWAALEFFEKLSFFHDCDGLIKSYCGYYVDRKCIRKILSLDKAIEKYYKL